MKQGLSERRVKPNHFIILAFAGILVIFLLIGYLWNVYMKKTRKADGMYRYTSFFSFNILLTGIFSILIGIPY